jgi:hypothetical protein
MKNLKKTFNWEVIENPVFINGVQHPKKKALMRSDTGAILSINSNRYRVFSNQKFERLIDRLVNLSGFEFMGYEEFQHGKRVLGFLKNTRPNLKICGQAVKDYLVIGNSHDGSSKIFIGTSNFIFRCENQFTEKIRTYELTHIHELDFSDQDLTRLLDVYEHSRRNYYRSMEQLSLVPLTNDMVKELVNKLLQTEQSAFAKSEVVNRYPMNDQMTNKERMFRESIVKETAALGNNLWGLFNGVTHYATHHINSNSFLNSNGASLEFNQKGLNICLDLFNRS